MTFFSRFNGREADSVSRLRRQKLCARDKRMLPSVAAMTAAKSFVLGTKECSAGNKTSIVHTAVAVAGESR